MLFSWVENRGVGRKISKEGPTKTENSRVSAEKFPGGGEPTKKKTKIAKIALFSLFQEGGKGKKTEKYQKSTKK